MHMADALISPAVGGTMWAATAGTMAFSVKRIKNDLDGKKIPLMGVMAAFVFAAQMINFAIPGTGSSGHLGGGLLLCATLGPYAGFLSMASILLIQALVFADGGLLAYGCNVFNLGFFTCFIAYPFIYRAIARRGSSTLRKAIAAMAASVAGLQMGAFGVVLETLLSGKTALPFGAFLLLMQPIHLAIGAVEGLVTAAVVAFVDKASPAILERADSPEGLGEAPVRRIVAALGIAFLVVGGTLSWFASSKPDGLEWSMAKVSGLEEFEAEGNVHEGFAAAQERTAFMPDYAPKPGDSAAPEAAPSWPAVDGGTSLAGILGGAIVLLLVLLSGFAIRLFKRRGSLGGSAHSA